MSDNRLLWLLARAREHRASEDIKPSHWAVLAMLLGLDAEGLASITKAELGALVHLKERQVSNVLKDLEGVLDLIRKEPKGGVGKGRAANLYAIRPDAIGNAVPETWRRKQSIAGNAVPSASPDQQSSTGNAVPVADVQDAEFVDNQQAACIGTGARAETPNLKTTSQLELNPEPVDLASAAVAAREGEPMRLNGTAKSLPAHQLLAHLIRIVDSPMLANSLGLHKTCQLIPQWMTDGADFDEDIVPTVRNVCGRMSGEPIRSLRYFDGAVRDAARTRLAIQAKKPNPIEASHDFAPRTTGNVHVSGGKISPASAHHMRAVKAARDADERRRMESGACK